MALADFLSALRRRWYLVLVGLLLTGALGYGAYTTNPPTYTARGLVLLLPSKAALKGSPNPLLDLDGLQLPGQVLVAYYASANAQAQFKAAVPAAGISVSIDDSTGGPVIAVDVTDPTPGGTMKALNYVIDSIPTDLARIQANVGAPEDSAVRSSPLVVDSKAKPVYSGMIRMTIAAVGVGVVGTAVVVFAVDGIALRRRRGKLAKRSQGDDDAAADHEPDDNVREPADDDHSGTTNDGTGGSVHAIGQRVTQRSVEAETDRYDDANVELASGAGRSTWSTQRR